jgi:anti-anti-sigma factor
VSRVVFLAPRRRQRLIQSARAHLRSLVWRPGADGPTDSATDTATGQTSDELRVRSRRSGAVRIVELGGKLNGSTRGPLADALEDALEGDAGQIVLDLGELESIDPAGLDVVLTAHLRASDELKVLLVVPGPEPVQRVFDAAQVPLFYASRPGGRVGARARSRRRRGGLSALPGRSEGRPQSLRRRP